MNFVGKKILIREHIERNSSIRKKNKKKEKELKIKYKTGKQQNSNISTYMCILNEIVFIVL